MKNLTLRTIVSAFLITSSAHALPFNDDMVGSRNQRTGEHRYYATGELMRDKPEGSVAVGQLEYGIKSKEEAEKLKNPRKGNPNSHIFGKRLFQVNCSPCHGNLELPEYNMGPVAMKFTAPPPITGEPYVTSRSDGYLYGTIHFGGLAVMPALGWKLSPTEHWDIINYIRHVQAMKAGK